MNRTQQLYRIFRPPQVFQEALLGQSNTGVLRCRRLFHYGGIKTPRRGGKYAIKTAIFTGTLLVGGICIKLHSRTVDEQEGKNENHQKGSVNVKNWQDAKTLSLSEAILQSRDLVQRKKDETGSPGLTIAVSVDGRTVWAEGIGYSDVENRLKCTPQSVFRIASISKSITAAAVAKLLESGDLDLDKPVQFYVPEFPEKTWDGKKVQITTRQLLSHLGGIRHYRKDYIKDKTGTDDSDKEKGEKTTKTKTDVKQPATDRDKVVKEESKDEMLLEEYYITRNYSSVLESLEIFKDDPLVHKPESKFLYTTHGWTLISAVVEKAAKMPFEKYLKKTLDELGLENTYLDEYKPLIYNRGRHYVQNKNGQLENAPYVDLSYKWAGGGLISNVLDMVKFGNAMLYSYQARVTHSKSSSAQTNSPGDTHIAYSDLSKSDDNNQHVPGFLRADTMKTMWTQVAKRESNWEGVPGGGYGLGWSVWCRKDTSAFCRDYKFFVSHTGAAVGASSVLLIFPTDSAVLDSKTDDAFKTIKSDAQVSTSFNSIPPQGVVVVIIANMMSVGLNKTAYDIARIFERVDL